MPGLDWAEKLHNLKAMVNLKKLKASQQGNALAAKTAEATAGGPKPLICVVQIETQLDVLVAGIEALDLNAGPILPITPSGTFDFLPPQGSPQWPGPRYEDLVQVLPGFFNLSHDTSLSRNKTENANALAKRTTSHDDCRYYGRWRPNRKLTKMAAATSFSTKRTFTKRPHFWQKPPTRDQPLHLLTLPGEIRNQVYRYLYVSKEPLYAKFRPIIRAHQGRSNPVMKRFPLEPKPALVCKQMKDEVLSLFYAENTFIFATSIGPPTSHTPTMAYVPRITAWMQLSMATAALVRVELRLGMRYSPAATDKEAVKYIFDANAQDRTQFAVRLETQTSRCTCFDTHFAAEGMPAVVDTGHAGNLLNALVNLVNTRNKAFLHAAKDWAAITECGECGNRRWLV